MTNQEQRYRKLLEDVGQGYIWGKETKNATAAAFSSGVLMGALTMLYPGRSDNYITKIHRQILDDLESRYDAFKEAGGLTFVAPLDNEANLPGDEIQIKSDYQPGECVGLLARYSHYGVVTENHEDHVVVIVLVSGRDGQLSLSQEITQWAHRDIFRYITNPNSLSWVADWWAAKKKLDG